MKNKIKKFLKSQKHYLVCRGYIDSYLIKIAFKYYKLKVINVTTDEIYYFIIKDTKICLWLLAYFRKNRGLMIGSQIGAYGYFEITQEKAKKSFLAQKIVNFICLKVSIRMKNLEDFKNI